MPHRRPTQPFLGAPWARNQHFICDRNLKDALAIPAFTLSFRDEVVRSNEADMDLARRTTGVGEVDPRCEVAAALADL